MLAAFPGRADDDYRLGPDSQPRSDGPQDKVGKFTFASSQVFPKTVRDYWVYVPTQYNPATPAGPQTLN